MSRSPDPMKVIAEQTLGVLKDIASLLLVLVCCGAFFGWYAVLNPPVEHKVEILR